MVRGALLETLEQADSPRTIEDVVNETLGRLGSSQFDPTAVRQVLDAFMESGWVTRYKDDSRYIQARHLVDG